MQNKLLKKFNEIFGKDGEVHGYFAPGRVNLIGEQIGRAHV